MRVRAVKTHKIRPFEDTLFSILGRYVKKMPERSVLAVTSKIVSLCEGSVVKVEEKNKDELVISEAEHYLPRKISKYNIMFAIKNGILAPSAGIDESNADGHYVLWPSDPQKTANKIREYLSKRFKLKNVGVIITDSKTSPLRWGTSGIAISHSGFEALRSYVGTPDIFGRKLKMTKANVMDALAASAVFVMGEGAEQIPLVVIEELGNVKFQSRNPSKKELKSLNINIEDDLYAPMLKAVKWRKGLSAKLKASNK